MRLRASVQQSVRAGGVCAYRSGRACLCDCVCVFVHVCVDVCETACLQSFSILAGWQSRSELPGKLKQTWGLTYVMESHAWFVIFGGISHRFCASGWKHDCWATEQVCQCITVLRNVWLGLEGYVSCTKQQIHWASKVTSPNPYAIFPKPRFWTYSPAVCQIKSNNQLIASYLV